MNDLTWTKYKYKLLMINVTLILLYNTNIYKFIIYHHNSYKCIVYTLNRYQLNNYIGIKI